MSRLTRKKALSLMLTVAILLAPLAASAEDAIEKAGVAVGTTAGNAIAVPAKAMAVAVGLTVGLWSFLLSGGNVELTKQIWNDVTEGPYVITPEVARTGIGERPELQKK
jgi:hypothetical protein